MTTERLIYELIANVGAPTCIAIFALWMLGRRLDEVTAEVRALRAELVLHVSGVRSVLEGRRRGDQAMVVTTTHEGR